MDMCRAFKILLVRLLVYLVYYHRIPETGWLINNRNLFLTALKVGKFKIRYQQIQDLVRACFLVHRWPTSCCILTWQKGTRKFSGVSFFFYPPHLPPLESIHLFSTSMSLFLPCKLVHLYHFPIFHTYALIYDICFSLSDLLHSVRRGWTYSLS